MADFRNVGNDNIINGIKNELNKIKKIYSSSYEQILSDYNAEKSITSDYEGRQILELLQNAEDQCVENGTVAIEFKDNKLTISNTGEPFSLDGVVSLLFSNVSSKTTNGDTIGNKGLGFRSILSWSNKVKVISRGFALEFSRENAIEVLNEILAENPELKKNLKAKSPDEYPIATLPCPKLIDDNVLEGFVTTISIDCKNNENVRDNIRKQIQSLDYKDVLFLRKIKTVIIKLENEITEIEKNVKDNKVIVSITENGIKKDIQCDLYSETGEIDIDNGKKKYEIAIAYSNTENFAGNYLYSYFKTEIPMAFPGILHASFNLTSNRNGIAANDKLNEKLVEKVTDFIVSTALKISKTQNKCDYTPFKLVIFKKNENKSLEDYKFYDLLREKAKTVKLLPSIADKYLSLKDNPIFIKRINNNFVSDFAYVLNKESFYDLLKICDDETVENFLGDFTCREDKSSKFYDYDDFCKRINKDIDAGLYSIEDKCRIMKIIAYIQNSNLRFNTSFKEYTGENLNILEDTEGNYILSGDKVFTNPSKNKIINPPNCINGLHFLSYEMEKLLMRDVSTKREICERYKNFGIVEYSVKFLVTQLINLLKENEPEGNVKEVLIWLFELYSSLDSSNGDESEDIKLNNVKVPVLCRNNCIAYSTECYLGSEFGNEIGETVIKSYTDKFVRNDIPELESKDQSKLKEFYKWIGVSEYPRTVQKELSKNEFSQYLDYCFSSNNPQLETTQGELIQEKEKRNISLVKATVTSIEKLDEILSSCSINQVLPWLIKDEKITKYLEMDFDNSDKVEVKIKWGQKKDRIIQKQYLPPYIKYHLCKTKWLNINGELCSPEYCWLSKMDLSPIIHTLEIDFKQIAKQLKIKGEYKIHEFLQKLGVAEEYTDFPISIQYEILLALPELDEVKGTKNARSLYNLRKNSNDADEVANNPACLNFKSKGKVLVKYNDGKEFVPIKDALYVDKKEFSDDLLKQHYIFDLDKRVGVDKVEKMFGVKPLRNLNVSVETVTPADKSIITNFDNDYMELLPFILVGRYGSTKNYKKDLGSLKNNKINIVTSICLKSEYSGNTIETWLNDYEIIYFRNDKKAYIKIPENINTYQEIKRTKFFSDGIADIITSILDVNEDKSFYRELVECNEKERELLIRSDKGDENLETLDDIRKDLKIEQNKRLLFWNTISVIKKYNSDYDNSIEDVLNHFGVDKKTDENIDYENISNPNNIEILKNLFNNLGISISQFNLETVYIIDYVPHWTRNFNKLKEEYKEAYKYYLYKEFLKGEINEERINSYGLKIQSYSNDVIDIPNDFDLDLRKKYNEFCHISIDDLENFKDKNIEIEIAKVKNEYIQKKGEEKLNELKNNLGEIKVNLYALFNSLGLLENISKKTSDEKKNDEPHMSQDEINSKAEEFIGAITEETVGSSSLENGTQNFHPGKGPGSKNGKNNGIYSKKGEVTKEIDGRAGELAVYKNLKGKYKTVNWRSSNAEKYGEILTGNDTLGYDIDYIDKEGTKKYVEVKASTSSNINFSISKNEIDFALQHSKDYEIAFVFLEKNENKNQAHITYFTELFDFNSREDFFNNSRFSVKNDSYKIAINTKQLP